MRMNSIGVDVILCFQDPPVPYELWTGDEWECLSCGSTLVAGWSATCTAHFEPDFVAKIRLCLEARPLKLRVEFESQAAQRNAMAAMGFAYAVEGGVRRLSDQRFDQAFIRQWLTVLA